MKNLPFLKFWRKLIGSRSEKHAASFLRARGYTILFRNWSCPIGELDLVARKDDVIVFVEVRSRSDETTERAALSVDDCKQRKVVRTALFFLKKYHLLECQARFDVAAICWPKNSRSPVIEHLEGAFESPV